MKTFKKGMPVRVKFYNYDYIGKFLSSDVVSSTHIVQFPYSKHNYKDEMIFSIEGIDYGD